MKLNFCCLIGLGADRSSLGRQGAEQFVPTEAPHHGPGAATRRRGGTGGSNRGPAATTRAPPAIAQFVYRGIGDRTIFYRPASTFSFHLESIFLSPAELRKFDKGIGDRRDCQKIMLKNGRNFPSGVLVVCVMKIGKFNERTTKNGHQKRCIRHRILVEMTRKRIDHF